MLNIVFVSQLLGSTSVFIPISSIPGIYLFDEIDYQSEREGEDEKNQKLKRKIYLRDNKAWTKEIKCLLNSIN